MLKRYFGGLEAWRPILVHFAIEQVRGFGPFLGLEASGPILARFAIEQVRRFGPFWALEGWRPLPPPLLRS